MSPIFNILFQTGDINTFVFRRVFFSRYLQLKSSFSGEKIWEGNQAGNLRHALVEKLSKIKRGKVLKENSIIGRSWNSAKLFIVQNNTEKATRCVPLTVQNIIKDIFVLRDQKRF